MTYSLYNICLTATVALSCADLSSAHLIMKSPVPYGVDTLNNSPLVDTAIGSSTSDFPCKQRSGVYKISSMNNMAVGESQTLSFAGSASHGGGTCQLAVSLDHEPTTNSTWKIIQVYEGGCPVTASGNAGTDTFTYKIPQNFPNGQATLAWTWYNRIGNREIYMNCAPITVTGGSDNQDYYNTLPDMYIINLPSSQCSSVETTNQIIPNPGQFVLTGDTADKAASATGAACAAAAAAQTQGVQGYQSGVQSQAAVSGSAAATTSVAALSTVATTANNGMYSQPSVMSTAAVAATTANSSQTTAYGMTTIATPSALSLAITIPAVSTSAVLPTLSTLETISATSTVAAVAATSGSSSSSSGCGSSTAGTTCTQNGAVVCNGASQFGLCNNGQVVWQAVAAGTTCSNGVIQKRSEVYRYPSRKQLLGRWFAAYL